MVPNSETKPSLSPVSFCIHTLTPMLMCLSGISETAVTPALPDNLFHSENAEEKRETSQSITLLQLLSQVYESKPSSTHAI
jgi:hypothetical protein